jgi:hypothetical protein
LSSGELSWMGLGWIFIPRIHPAPPSRLPDAPGGKSFCRLEKESLEAKPPPNSIIKNLRLFGWI